MFVDVGVQSIVKKTTEAVVKFELLSSDPQSEVHICSYTFVYEFETVNAFVYNV